MLVFLAIPDPTRNSTRTQPENKRVWVLISDPPTRQPVNFAGWVRVTISGYQVDPRTRIN